MNDYWPCWFLHTMSYKQTHLVPVSYKDSSLKVLINFQVWARLSCRSMYFFVFVFSYLLYECVPCHTGWYQTLSTSGTGTLLWLHKLATKILQLVAKRRPNNFFNFKPCLTNKILITASWLFFVQKLFGGGHTFGETKQGIQRILNMFSFKSIPIYFFMLVFRRIILISSLFTVFSNNLIAKICLLQDGWWQR